MQGPEKRKEYNIKDNLVRFSCGVEDVEDIWNDLAQVILITKRTGICVIPTSRCINGYALLCDAP